MAEISLVGMQELLDKITELGRKGTRIENQALLKAAEPILNDAVNNAPEMTGKGKAGLKIGRPKSKGDEKYVLIGIDEGDISEIFYMKFHEFGTSRETARPFMAPAYEKNKDEVLRIISDEFRRELGVK